MALSVSPDLTVYLAGSAAACFAAGRVADDSRALVAPDCRRAAAAADEWCTGVSVAAWAAGALARATAAARPASAGAATPSRRMLRVRADSAWQPKRLLPEKVALTRKAACT